MDTTKWDPTNINGVISTVSRVISPQLPIYKVIYRGPITPFISSRGPPCKISMEVLNGVVFLNQVQLYKKNTYLLHIYIYLWIGGTGIVTY